MTVITISAPATVSNVGPGFDVFGFALQREGERLCLELRDDGGVTLGPIQYEGLGKPGSVPEDPQKNIAAITISTFLESQGISKGVHIDMTKCLPVGSGLGGSACSAVAAAVGVNALFETKLNRDELLAVALEGEKTSSGTEHLDNIAPCLMGGFTIIRSSRPVDIVSIAPPANLFCTVILPDHVILTQAARKVLPEDVPLTHLVRNTANAASLVAALCQGDLALLKRSVNDCVVEPVRAQLLPGFDKARQAALDAGALGCSISGSGPAVFAFADSKEAGENIGAAAAQVFQQEGMKTEFFVSAIAASGTHFI